MVKLSKIKACPECGSDNIIYDKKKGEIVCEECGAIFSELSPDEEQRFEDASDVI
jgi:transcription initiation factor TFIIIB Brf1 subunit/transcription initiation factor TFIIB